MNSRLGKLAVKRTQRSLYFMFALIGVVSTAWVPRIPEYKKMFELSDGRFSLLLLGSTFGALASAQLSGRFIHRFTSRPVGFFAAFGMSCGLFLMASAHTPQVMFLGLFILAYGYVSLDICSNYQAIAVERLLGIRQLSKFHGMWSVGAFSSALLGGFLSKISSPATELHFIAGIGFVALLFGVSMYLRGDLESERDELEVHEVNPPWFSSSTVILWSIGIGLLGALIPEGAAGDWSGILLREHMGITGGFTAAAFASFTLAMIFGRLFGDKAFNRFGLKKTVKYGGFVGGGVWALSIGIAVPLSSQTKTLSLIIICIGFAAAGAAVGPMFPAFILAASVVKGMPSSIAISRVNVIGLAAFFIGPIITGGLATISSLPIAMIFPITLLFVAGIQSRVLPR